MLPRRISSRIRSAVRHARAMIVSVGFLSAFEAKTPSVRDKDVLDVPSLGPRIRDRACGRGAHDGAAHLVDDRAAGFDRLGPIGIGRARAHAAHGCDPVGEGPLHVRHLADLVLRPLPVEPQDGDSPLVDHLGIDLAVGIGIRDHLSAPREGDVGAVMAARLLLEPRAVACAPARVLAVGTIGLRHLPACREFDVVAAREAELSRELLLVEPPRGVHVIAARAVLVVGWKILKERDIAAPARPHGVHDVLPDQPARVGESVGEEGRL